MLFLIFLLLLGKTFVDSYKFSETMSHYYWKLHNVFTNSNWPAVNHGGFDHAHPVLPDADNKV